MTWSLDAARNIGTVASGAAAWAALVISFLTLRRAQRDRTVRLRVRWFEQGDRSPDDSSPKPAVIRIINEGRKVEIERVTIQLRSHYPEIKTFWLGPFGVRTRVRARDEGDVDLRPPVNHVALEVEQHAALDLKTEWGSGKPPSGFAYGMRATSATGVRVRTRCGFEKLFVLEPLKPWW